MDVRSLGTHGPTVSAMGLGCMGMSEFYGTRDDDESVLTIHAALDAGLDFLDTADMYGPYTNEELVGKAIADRRDKVVLATKFGIVRDPADPTKRGICGRPDYVRASCEGSLKRLGVETIDLYYLHRVDPATPIEDTVGAMAGLGREGKVRWIGLSEAAPETLRRASRVHPIAALLAPRRSGRPARLPRARDRVRRLQPARARVPLASLPQPRGFPGRRLSAHGAALPERELREEPRARHERGGDREAPARHAGTGRPRVGPRAGRRHRADLRDEEPRPAPGERRRRRRRPHEGRPRRARGGLPARRRGGGALPSGRHGDGRPLSLFLGPGPIESAT